MSLPLKKLKVKKQIDLWIYISCLLLFLVFKGTFKECPFSFKQVSFNCITWACILFPLLHNPSAKLKSDSSSRNVAKHKLITEPIAVGSPRGVPHTVGLLEELEYGSPMGSGDKYSVWKEGLFWPMIWEDALVPSRLRMVWERPDCRVAEGFFWSPI